MKCVCASLALVALLYMTANVASISGAVDGIKRAHYGEVLMNSSQTFTKVVGNVTYSRTYVKLADETETEFDKRAKALWAEYCTLHGI
jgi:hypothetical protein